MFWSKFAVDYLSSVFAGITLGAIGLTIYSKYYVFRNNKPMQKNYEGNNIIQNIENQNNNSVFTNVPEKSVSKNTNTFMRKIK